MKKLTLYTLLITGFLISSFSQAITVSNNELKIRSGENKTFRIETIGAASASGVTVTTSTGATATGITAILLPVPFNPNQVDVIITAGNNASVATAKVNFQLSFGVHKKTLLISQMPKVNVRVSGSGIAGQKQRVDLGNIDSLFMGAISTTGTGYPIVRQGSNAYFEVRDSLNTDHTVNIDLSDSTSDLNHFVENKRIRVRFRKDSSVPTTLTAPTINSSRNLSVTTSQPQANSPRLSWNRVDGANQYVIEYKKYRGPGVLKTALVEVNNVTSTTLKDIEVGDYYWRIRAKYQPAEGSIFRSIMSGWTQPSSFQFSIIQDSSSNKRSKRVAKKATRPAKKATSKYKQKRSIVCPKGKKLVKDRCI